MFVIPQRFVVFVINTIQNSFAARPYVGFKMVVDKQILASLESVQSMCRARSI